MALTAQRVSTATARALKYAFTSDTHTPMDLVHFLAMQGKLMC